MGIAAKLAVAAATVAAAVVLFFVLRPEDEAATGTTPTATKTGPTTTQGATEPGPTTTEESDQPAVIRIAYVNGEVAGPRRAEVALDERVVLVVRADVADHVHVHGYDLMRDVAPGAPARIAFEANARGRFEVELEDRHLPLTELVVVP
jgi:hypothetical protein